MGEAVSTRGGEAGMDEQEDSGDDITSISIGSSRSDPSPPAAGSPAALGCADWTLQKW
jgi:hypothetical protein